MNNPKKKTVKSSTPAFMVGVEPQPVDFVPDAETPEKAMQLTENDWNWHKERKNDAKLV